MGERDRKLGRGDGGVERWGGGREAETGFDRRDKSWEYGDEQGKSKKEKKKRG